MTEITLKPLPEPFASAEAVSYSFGENIKEPVYTASQVEQIRRDAVRDALGAAAEACRIQRMSPLHPNYSIDHNNAIRYAEMAIRALMPKEEGK